MCEEGLIAQADGEHRCACVSVVCPKTWVCDLSEYISFTGFIASLDTYSIYCLLFHVLEHFSNLDTATVL
jgi:hypothetical protein